MTTYGYDGDNNTTSITNALNQTTTFFYDQDNLLYMIEDPAGNSTSRGFDNDLHETTSIDSNGDTTAYTYDAAGNLLTVTDPAGNVVSTNTYDACNQLLQTTDALGRVSSRTYDSAHFVTSRTDPLGRVTAFVHDALGRTTAINAPLSNTASQGFDADGNRTTLVNPNQKSTVVAFDPADRLTQVTTSTGKTTAYAYNNRSLTSSVTLPSGASTVLTYDALGHTSTATDSVGAITFGYDKNGHVTSTAERISSTTKTISRQYDVLGRLTQFTDGAGNVVKYSYTNEGDLSTMTYPDGKVVTYGYDAARRLKTVTDWASRVTTYAYDLDSRVATITRPDKSVETLTYDSAGQVLESRDVAANSTVLHDMLRIFDLGGKIVAESITPAVTVYLPSTLTMTFDADNRLATINSQAANYDANGNLLSATIPGSSLTAFTYDARNRLVSAGGLTYGYDAENRRVSVTSAAGTTSYVTSPLGVLDRVLVKTSSSGTVTRYVYGIGLIGEETNSAFTTYHYDARGSTTALTDINGNVTQTFSYGTNGEPAGFSPSAAPTQFLYGGEYGVATDTTGICYMRARYYLPVLGRFVNQDTLLGNIAPGVALNRFAYANCDPINKNDPFGLAAQPLVTANVGVEADFVVASISETIDTAGVQTIQGSIGEGLTFGAYYSLNHNTDESNFGISFGPGIKLGPLGGASATINLGTDGASFNPGGTYGIVTGGVSIPLSLTPGQVTYDEIEPGDLPLGDGLYEPAENSPDFFGGQ